MKKLSRKLTIVMPATLFIISEQNIHQFITFNFESCCYPKIPQYQRLAHIHKPIGNSLRVFLQLITLDNKCYNMLIMTSVVTKPDFAMRYISRYLGHDAIRIAILVYRVSQSLDLQFVYDGNAIYRARYTLPNHHNRCRMCWSLAVA